MKQRKKFVVSVSMPNGEVTVHSGEFDPDSADVYKIHISPRHGRHSLVVKEVKKALDLYEAEIVRIFDEVPESLKKKLGEYLPFEMWEFNSLLRNLKKSVYNSWKI